MDINEIIEPDTIVNATGTIYKNNGITETVSFECMREIVLDTYVNNEFVYRLECSPLSIKELIIGRAFTNSLIIKASDIKSINIDIEDHRVDMITIPSEHDPLMSQDIHPKAIDTNEIFKLIDKLINDPDKKNIGHHKAYIKLSDGSIRSFEDIGRHNTIDKAIGHMLINEFYPAECVIMTSGRITKEMIDKVAVAGIPVMISPKKVTTTAIDIAKASGTRLIILAKPDSFISL